MNRPTLIANIDALHATLLCCSELAVALDEAASLIAEALRSGKKLLICGNGGSAADAMHLSSEFLVRFNQDRRPYPSICLTANGGDLTAIGNDYAYEQVFERQVQAFACPGDVLVSFTSSGNSRNTLLAIEAATKAGASSVTFLGKDGGFIKGRSTIELLVPERVTARVQEAQKLLLHSLCEIVEWELGHRDSTK